MLSLLPAALLSLAAVSEASSVLPRQAYPGMTTVDDGLHCRQFNMDITASAMNSDYSYLGKPANQMAQIQRNINSATTGNTDAARAAAAPKVPVSGTYSMFFEYCYPTNVALNPSILQNIHGLVGNAKYWNNGLDSPNGTLSFARAMGNEGYATLSYDRLCVGKSAKPDGTLVCQQPYEQAQAIEISKKIRDGSLTVGNWGSVVGVGHSYGSILLAGVASTHPDAYDGTVLTGFTANVTSGPLGLAGFQSSIASGVNSTAYGDLANDYLVTPSVSVDQVGFFHYDPSVPSFSDEAIEVFTTGKGAYTTGQQLSIGGPYSLMRPNYTAPVIVVTGNEDGPFCAANCSDTSLGAGKTQLDTATAIYPGVAASDIELFVVPESGHGINFHNSAPQAYSAIATFLKKHNL